MSYSAGELKFCAVKPSDDCSNEDYPPSFDSRSDYSLAFPVFWLPHSCDEWVIGGVPEAKAFLADLAAAIEVVEQRAGAK